MGYRNSPTCSHCWQQGHTKRGCPKYREKAEAWLEENKDNEDAYKPHYVQQVERYKNIGKNRKCSWCDEHGHNKRTCPDKKEVLDKNIAKNKEWRRQVLDRIEEAGLGVGALVADKNRYSEGQKLYLVVDMRWDGINLRASGNECVEYYEYQKHNYRNGSTYPEMTVSSIDDLRTKTLYYPQLKDADDNGLFYSASTRLNVVSPSEPNPPSGWISDESWAKKLF
jgi:hypothetical protein|tara:strand:+ start:4382 stop:5053 length:672 start_codon:yes stop_codon:yes gene_type:complete